MKMTQTPISHLAAVKPEVWVFVDERFERGVASDRFIVGCIVCSKERWMALHDEAVRIGSLGQARRLDGIRQLLDKLQGFALLAYADLSIAQVRPGEIDGTDDIPEMKRHDNVWSQSLLAAAAAVLACLRTSGVESAEIDLYYDPKSLTMAHRDAWEMTLRETLSEIAKEDPETGGIQLSPALAFRRIEQVPKRQGEIEGDCAQHGTFLADRLCSQAPHLIGGEKVPRVLVRDHTTVLCSMVSKFAGESSGG